MKMAGAFLLFLLAASAKADLIEECMNYTIYPLQYELIITPYITEGSFYYYCQMTVDIIANAPDIRVIELDAKDLVIRQGSIRVFDGKTDIVNGARPYEYEERNGKLYIYLREPLRKYDTRTQQYVYQIQIAFTKYVTEDTAGVFVVKYFDEESKEYKYMYTTRFSPNKAKYAFPCFNNPRFEAGFKFKVFIPPPRVDLQLTNTSLVIAEELKRETLSNNYQSITFMPSPQVALQQLGFHFSQFSSDQLKAKRTNDTLVVWSPADELKHYNFVLHYGVTIIDLIHEFSRTNRPLLNGPINLVPVPKKLDGYEISSWNLLTNSAFKLANIEGMTSIRQLERMKFELAQQLSRLWLGNPGESQVTRWREEWFKEGMATYLAYYLLAQYNYGSQTTNRKRPLGAYGLQMKQRAMASDWHHSTPALSNFHNELAVEIPSRYHELVTMKTGAIWWMLGNWFQADQLHASLVKHINAMRGQYISLWDLIGAIDKDTIECTYQFFNGSTPSRILSSWFHQAGYPVVHVNVLRDRNPNAIQLKQRHFSYTALNREPTEYQIPISYLVQSNHNCFNCHMPRFTIGQTYTFSENLNRGWIVLNRNASGYYRINYDADTWRIIAISLQQDHNAIDEMNRAQIVNDVFALYMAGDMDRTLAEQVLEYLDKERSPVVWDAVIDGFDMLRIDGARTRMTKHTLWEWEAFIEKKVEPMFNILVKNNDKSLQNRLFRSNIITFACAINHEPCIKFLEMVHDDAIQGRTRLDPDIREAVFYLYENRTNSGFVNSQLNPIELEDKLYAEHRVRERNRFLMRLVYGEARPMPIISTDMPKPVPSVTEKLEHPMPGSAVHHFCSFITLLTALIVVIH